MQTAGSENSCDDATSGVSLERQLACEWAAVEQRQARWTPPARRRRRRLAEQMSLGGRGCHVAKVTAAVHAPMPSIGPPQRVAFLYTGQARTFSVRWQHENHLESLVRAKDALFHGFHVHTFFVLPEDQWLTDATRAELLSLPTFTRLVTYDPRNIVVGNSSDDDQGDLQ